MKPETWSDATLVVSTKKKIKGDSMANKYKDYLEFLETAVASENLKKNDPKKWEEMKAKLKKERFLRKLKVKK